MVKNNNVVSSNEKYIIKIYYRADKKIKLVRTEVRTNEILNGSLLKSKVPGKFLYFEFE